jgi:HK97 family phage portal protein
MGDESFTVTDRRHSAGSEIEVRDPRGATATVGWVNAGRPTLPAWNTEASFREGYLASALVNRAINILADRISQLPFRAGRDPDSPENFDKRAPLAQLLGPPPGNPNPETSARALWKNAIRNWLVAGRFAWELERVGGRGQDGQVIGLWPLIMANLAYIATDSGRQYFSGFEYNVKNTANPITYRRDEIVYAWNASPEDPREPMSVIQAIRWNVSVVLQIDRYNYAFVHNDAKPSTLVVHGPFATSEAQDAFRRQFSANFKGPLNANKTMFNAVDPADDGTVAGLLDIKTIGASAKDSQLTQIYDQQLDAITTGLGVPMSLMDASGRTFSNADAEERNFYNLTILPLCADLQDAINRDLAPKVGNEIGWFDISKVDALKPHLSTGVSFADVSSDMLIDERRGFAGLGPVDTEELFAEKQQSLELMQLPGGPPPGGLDGADTPLPPTAPVVAGEPPAQPAVPAVPSPRVPRQLTRGELIDERADAARPQATERLTWLLERQLTELTTRSLAATEARADGKRGRQAITSGEGTDALYDRRYWHDQTRTALAPVVEAALTAAESALAGLLPGQGQERLDWWVEHRCSDLGYEIVRARWEALRTTRAETVEDLMTAVRAGHADPCLRASPRELAFELYDDAVRQLAGVPRETVRDLLTRLTTGDVDLDRAMKELTDA